MDRTGPSRVTEGCGRHRVRDEWTGLDLPESQRVVEDIESEMSGQDWTFQSHRGLWKASQRVDRTAFQSQRNVEDNVRQWTGLDFPESHRVVEDDSHVKR